MLSRAPWPALLREANLYLPPGAPIHVASHLSSFVFRDPVCSCGSQPLCGAGVGGGVSGLPELGTILTDVLLRVGGAEAGERGPWKPIGTKFCLLKANPGAGAPGERVAAHKPRREEGPGQARQLPI